MRLCCVHIAYTRNCLREGSAATMARRFFVEGSNKERARGLVKAAPSRAVGRDARWPGWCSRRMNEVRNFSKRRQRIQHYGPYHIVEAWNATCARWAPPRSREARSASPSLQSSFLTGSLYLRLLSRKWQPIKLVWRVSRPRPAVAPRRSRVRPSLASTDRASTGINGWWWCSSAQPAYCCRHRTIPIATTTITTIITRGFNARTSPSASTRVIILLQMLPFFRPILLLFSPRHSACTDV